MLDNNKLVTELTVKSEKLSLLWKRGAYAK